MNANHLRFFGHIKRVNPDFCVISALESNISLHLGRAQKFSNSDQNYLVRVRSAVIGVNQYQK